MYVVSSSIWWLLLLRWSWNLRHHSARRGAAHFPKLKSSHFSARLKLTRTGRHIKTMEDMEAPRPRLCHIIKRPDFVGYGFNLHAEKAKPGQYIGEQSGQIWHRVDIWLFLKVIWLHFLGSGVCFLLFGYFWLSFGFFKLALFGRHLATFGCLLFVTWRFRHVITHLATFCEFSLHRLAIFISHQNILSWHSSFLT